MTCTCDEQHQRSYYANPQLWTENKSGTPGGSGFHVGTVEVTVCKSCGKAEFEIPAEIRERFMR